MMKFPTDVCDSERKSEFHIARSRSAPHSECPMICVFLPEPPVLYRYTVYVTATRTTLRTAFLIHHATRRLGKALSARRTRRLLSLLSFSSHVQRCARGPCSSSRLTRCRSVNAVRLLCSDNSGESFCARIRKHEGSPIFVFCVCFSSFPPETVPRFDM